MTLEKQKDAPTLSAWLTIATQELVPSAQVRVRAEIEAHHAEAVQAHRQAGASEAKAQAASLADLGDAGKAARRFRHEHLTQYDLTLLKELTLPAAYWIAINLVMVVLLFQFVSPKYSSLVLLALIWMILRIRQKAKAPTLSTAQDIENLGRLLLRRFVLGFSLSALLIGVALTVYVQVSLTYKSDDELLKGDVMMFYNALIALVAAGSWFQFLQLRRKLLRAGQDDLPPNRSVA